MTYEQFNELKKEFYTLTPKNYTTAEINTIKAIIEELIITGVGGTIMQGILPFFKSIKFVNVEPTYNGYKITIAS